MDTRVVEYHEYQTPSGGTTAANCGLPAGGISCRLYEKFMLDISGLTTETVQVQVSHNDGATWSSGIKPTAFDGSTPAAVTLGNGSYYFDKLAAQRIRLVKSAAAEAVSISLGLRS